MSKNQAIPVGLGKPKDDWETEDALRTLLRAKEIKADAKMMAKVKALMAFKLQEMKKVGAELNLPI